MPVAYALAAAQRNSYTRSPQGKNDKHIHNAPAVLSSVAGGEKKTLWTWTHLGQPAWMTVVFFLQFAGFFNPLKKKKLESE